MGFGLNFNLPFVFLAFLRRPDVFGLLACLFSFGGEKGILLSGMICPHHHHAVFFWAFELGFLGGALLNLCYVGVYAY